MILLRVNCLLGGIGIFRGLWSLSNLETSLATLSGAVLGPSRLTVLLNLLLLSRDEMLGDDINFVLIPVAVVDGDDNVSLVSLLDGGVVHCGGGGADGEGVGGAAVLVSFS